MSRNYDSSALIQRKAQQAIAGGFLNQINASNGSTVQGWGSRPTVGIKDASILAAVKVGAMTEYTRYPTCIAISPGCPCGPLLDSLIHPPFIPAIPGAVTGITFTVGSIIVSWSAPTTGDGPFTYDITPFLNGVALPPVTTTETSYRFTDLEEWQPYTFTVCASNTAGSGPLAPSGVCLAPPADLSAFLASLTSNTTGSIHLPTCMMYILNCALDDVLTTLAKTNVGPTKGARLIYLYLASITQAWNWVTADTNIVGVKDNWDWTNNKAPAPLSETDAMVWFICATKYINSFITTVPSMFNCPADVVARVQAEGHWDSWVSAWSAWYAGRMYDGSIDASSSQPISSANWNETIVVDGVTVNNIAAFPEPQQWTRLTVNGNIQNYLTHDWDSVQSTCLTEAEEMEIQGAVAPATGLDRDAEIDLLINLAANLTDEEKMIAEFWAGSTTNYLSPPLMAIWLCKEYLRSSSPVSCQTILYSLLEMSIHVFEGSRVTWRLKAQYMQDRPIQQIRRRYAGQAITSWNGTVDGAQWVPYQPANFITPPFPDFPSGHSHFMKGFALTMTKWFGAAITANPIVYDMETLFSPSLKTNESTTFGTFTLPVGSSTVQPGVSPSVPVTLTFATWDDIANQAGMSRLYGGIHPASAHYASQTTAALVDGFIQTSWNIATSS